jgi:predicted transcriptional regulator
MSSLYVVTNGGKVFSCRTSSGLVLPGSVENREPAAGMPWLPIKSNEALGPAGFFWEGSEAVNCYHCSISDYQASIVGLFLEAIDLASAWERATGAAKFALQLVIDKDFLNSLSRDIELYVLDRVVANKEFKAKDLAAELNLDLKSTRRGLEELESKNLISFWTRQGVYRATPEGESYVLQYGWTPDNKSSDVVGLPVATHDTHDTHSVRSVVGQTPSPSFVQPIDDRYEYDTAIKAAVPVESAAVISLTKEARRAQIKDIPAFLQEIAKLEAEGFSLYPTKGKYSVASPLARRYGYTPAGIMLYVEKVVRMGLLPKREKMPRWLKNYNTKNNVGHSSEA